MRGYTNLDPAPKGQKAITPNVIREHFQGQDGSNEQAAIADLFASAFFFAMRSCEYLSVPGTRRTKRLCLRNLRFFKGNRELSHNNPYLENADTVSVTFEFQKNDERNDTVTQYRTNDPVLCPVIRWAAVVRRVLSLQGTDRDSAVNTYFDPITKKNKLITAITALAALRRTVTRMGKDRLGYTADEMGTHSIRSGTAMAMYLDRTPVYTIMLLGRWSSDAFLRYIRKQVQNFSQGVSRRMIRNPEFFTIPEELDTPSEDPHAPGLSQNFSARGSHLGLPSEHRTSAFALWS